jgi:uncharacterized protein with PIN domain
VITTTSLLIDEDSLGVARYLGILGMNIIKIGDTNAPPLQSSDEEVAKYAKDHNCIVITRDDKLVKQCNVLDIQVIAIGIDDLARKVIKTLEKK